MDFPRRLSAGVVVVATAALVTAAEAPAPTVPLCAGLTIVTAVNQSDGDYESIKTVESATDTGVRIKYSSERQVVDLLADGPPKLQKLTLYRMLRRIDLQSAFLYEQQFSSELPEAIPETTAIGTSAAVLNALKTRGEAKLGIFIPYTQIKPPADRNVHPNVYDNNQMVTTVTRTGTAPMTLPVIVNEQSVKLPVIQASGDFFGDKTEFDFLDDPANPIALMFRIGIGAIKPLAPDVVKECEKNKTARERANLGPTICDRPNGGDKDVLRVVKITYRCAVAPATPAEGSGGGQLPGGTGAEPEGAGAIERALANTGKIDIYSIFFSFNSDVIREESEPTLKDIADVLRRHSDWHLAVNGHTDGIGGDQPNLDLSKRRAAAVKDALVKRYGIDPQRLVTSGFGKSQPKDTNDTLEGRAHNRRVELAKIG